MKKLLTLILLLTLSTLALAKDIDINKSKGIDQDVIVQLIPSPAQSDVSQYTTIEAIFNIPLDVKHVKKHDVKLRSLSDKKKKKIKGEVSYIEADKKVMFTPKAPLAPGMYEVEFKSLKADKAYKDTKIKHIKYRFIVVEKRLQSILVTPQSIEIKEGEQLQLQALGHYDNGTESNITTQVQWSVADIQIVTVDTNATLNALKGGTTTVIATMESVEASVGITVYKEINGYRLPPEPDETLNNSTLLGIDVNNNGVRDDVERWIYETYKDKHPIHIDIAMQAGRAYKQVLETPERAKEIHDEVDKAVYCQLYYRLNAKYFNEPLLVKENAVNEYFRSEIYFNIQERMDAYIQYDTLLSGDSYTLLKFKERKAACDFNTSKYEK